MVKVLGVIGARLNSSRLPGKHLLDLAGQPMIARIFQRLELIPELDHIILATTADEYNQPLINWAKTANKAVFAYKGDVNDVMGRVDAIVEQSKPEIVVYFCGDSPLIEAKTVSNMISALLLSPDADYVCLKPSTTGNNSIHVGFYPYRYKVWHRMVVAAQTPSECEHVGLSIHHFIADLSNVYIDDDPVFSQSEHRISVDTPSDYQFMSEVYRRWYSTNNAATVVSLPWVIGQLSHDVKLQTINANVRQKKVSDEPINVLLVTQCGLTVGLGHLARMLVLARALQDIASVGVRMLIQGDVVSLPELTLLPHRFIGISESLAVAVEEELQTKVADALVFDIVPSMQRKEMGILFSQLKQKEKILIAVDGLFEWIDQIDFIHVPSFYLAPKFRHLIDRGKVAFGWENYILPLSTPSSWETGNKLLVLTGGSDVHQLGKNWPKLLDQSLPDDTEVHWVQGPFSDEPDIPTQPRLRWICHQSPENLPDLMSKCNYALTLYGVSLFELLLRGIPTVVLVSNLVDNEEKYNLIEEQVAVIVDSSNLAIESISNLIQNNVTAQHLSNSAILKMGNASGALILTKKIVKLVEESKS